MLAKGSTSWILSAIILTGIIGVTSYFMHNLLADALFLVMILFTVFLIWFFRDPVRDTKVCDHCIIAPADGRVIDISGRKVCIFMNLHNVHVNRAPISGEIIDIRHKKGGYLPAFMKDSERNERVVITIDSVHGKIEVTQIAGVLVRRIVPYIKQGDTVIQGQKIGMIRLGSRVDVTIPEDMRAVCHPGDNVIAGKTIIAKRIKR